MLTVLRLRTSFRGIDDEQSTIHDSSTRQHRNHQTMMARTVHKTDGPQKLGWTTALRANALYAVVFTFCAPVKCCVCVAHAYRDPSP